MFTWRYLFIEVKASVELSYNDLVVPTCLQDLFHTPHLIQTNLIRS